MSESDHVTIDLFLSISADRQAASCCCCGSGDDDYDEDANDVTRAGSHAA